MLETVTLTKRLYDDLVSGLDLMLSCEQSMHRVLEEGESVNFSMSYQAEKVTTGLLEELYELTDKQTADALVLKYDRALKELTDGLEAVEKHLDSLPDVDDHEHMLVSLQDRLQWAALEVHK